MKATFQGITIAQSNTTVEVDGIWYFPKTSVNHELLANSEMTTFCPEKGRASYFHIRLQDAEAQNSVFVYQEAEKGFSHIRGWYGFWPQPGHGPEGLTITME